jgi:hypothetical protein
LICNWENYMAPSFSFNSYQLMALTVLSKPTHTKLQVLSFQVILKQIPDIIPFQQYTF